MTKDTTLFTVMRSQEVGFTLPTTQMWEFIAFLLPIQAWKSNMTIEIYDSIDCARREARYTLAMFALLLTGGAIGLYLWSSKDFTGTTEECLRLSEPMQGDCLSLGESGKCISWKPVYGCDKVRFTRWLDGKVVEIVDDDLRERLKSANKYK